MSVGNKISKVISFVLLLSMAVAFPVLGQDTAPVKKRLTNKDVIEMVQMGLSEDVVIAKIRTATATDTNSVSLDTSVDGSESS